MKTKTFRTPSGNDIAFTELGFGSASIGNLYRAYTEDEAQATMNAAWDSGIRYFDTAPFYGLGLAETRLNHFLRGKKRDSYVLSTKVGRRLGLCRPEERAGVGNADAPRDLRLFL